MWMGRPSRVCAVLALLWRVHKKHVSVGGTLLLLTKRPGLHVTVPSLT